MKNCANNGYGKNGGKTLNDWPTERGHEVGLRNSTQDNASTINCNDLKASRMLLIEFVVLNWLQSHIKNCIAAQLPIVIGNYCCMINMITKKECIENNAAFLAATNFSVLVSTLFFGPK